ncbi:C-C motif chemokine 13-like, partial [Clarias magur]
MKASCVLFLLGFVIIAEFSSKVQPFIIDVGKCCFKFVHGIIPPDQVRTVEKTDSHCYKHGFFVTLSDGSLVKKRPDLYPSAEDMTMTRAVFLSLGFVLIVALSVDAMPARAMNHGPCCFKFYTEDIDIDVLKVERTDSRCSQQGF